jgi:hypothetical protein
LIDDVYASGNALRLYVLSMDAYACNPTTGEVTPEVPDQEVGTLPDAVVDVALGRDQLTNHEVRVPPGAWTIFVRGRGNDPMTGRMNVPIARGCNTAMVGNGETFGVTIMLAPITVMGLCGDGILSPDEQCERTAPECAADCRTMPEPLISMFADSDQVRPRAAGRLGRRAVAVWVSDNRDIGLRVFDPLGRPLVGMGPLAVDTTLDMLQPLPGAQMNADVAVAPDGRFAIALTDLGGDTDVRVSFWDENRNPMGSLHQHVRSNRTGVQQNPALSFHSSGALMVVFEDASSPTGLSGRVFAAGATTPSGAEAFAVGMGQSGARAPAIAPIPSGFVVAFAAGGNVFFQRFSDGGSPIDANAQPAADGGGMREDPAVAALADGTFLLAWTEMLAPGDGMGTGVRARVFGPDGMPRSMPFLVNTTLEGNQGRPAVAAAGTRFLVAFQSERSVRARGFDQRGEPILNRERPPNFADFEVAAAGRSPWVTAIGSGPEAWFWVLYEGEGNGSDIFARRFPL